VKEHRLSDDFWKDDMIWYLLLSAAIGLFGAMAKQSWIVLALVGAVLLPIGIGILVLAGDNGWAAAVKTFVQLKFPAFSRLLRISLANNGPKRFHQDLTVSWQMTMPRSCSRSSTFRNDKG
jgi:hypothetical protein